MTWWEARCWRRDWDWGWDCAWDWDWSWWSWDGDWTETKTGLETLDGNQVWNLQTGRRIGVVVVAVVVVISGFQLMATWA